MASLLKTIEINKERAEKKMEKVYLKFPTIEEKEKWMEYLKEYRSIYPKAKPLGCTEDIQYEEWLNTIMNEHKGINLQEGRVPSSVYFLMCDDRIVGTLSLRHNLENELLSAYGGHIGYGVRPSERRKGYATTMLNLALEKCEELGLDDIMVTCKEDNVASARTIEKNGGILKEVLFVPEEKCNFKIYWINVKESLKKKDTIRVK